MRISDWSSDVCSSDLLDAVVGLGDVLAEYVHGLVARVGPLGEAQQPQIGRASSRERVCQYVLITDVAVSLIKKAINTHNIQDSLYPHTTELTTHQLDRSSYSLYTLTVQNEPMP